MFWIGRDERHDRAGRLRLRQMSPIFQFVWRTAERARTCACRGALGIDRGWAITRVGDATEHRRADAAARSFGRLFV